ncbi:hypothetical protein TSUD_87330 [Trifolium subterraneum]|uniref:CCHC-type domain-containing protein n=1 Tax=Trifolium subterraneum TaxID=3900 RepID=A0A2Z6PEN9_TRISU|nr:hypothetical protein TSUD_87330 [Trifolium subterraneum]
MKEEETIDQMYGRFTSIINELNSLGKSYTTHERIRKILRCLPKNWRPIVTAITVAKDLTKVSLEDLIGSLKAHESVLQEDKPKRKMIALETQSGECSQKDETLCEDEESLQEDEEEELAFLSRRIQRLMTRRNQLKKNFQPKRNGAKPEVDLSKIQCYGCNQFGHYKNDCPKNKQKKPFFKKKSMMATWDDLEEAQSEDEEQEANVCLMTHSNAEEVTLDPGSSCNTEDDVRTRKALQDVETNLGLISQIEPRSINEAIIDESWIEAMKEELHQFEKNEVWNLVPSPEDNSIIGTRWVFRNKLDENGKVVRNKARLVAQGYNQQEGIDYDETFALVASEFEMSMMGELGFFLGLQIKQLEDGIFISQEKYVNDLLKKYKMNEAKIMSTPMHPSTSLDKDEKGKDVSEKEYRGMIGSLLYLTASRPDIVFAVALCARFQTSPKESHLIAERETTPEIQSTPVTTNMQTTVENPPNSQNSPNNVFQPSSSKSPENSPINLTQNQPSPPVDSPKHSPNPEIEEDVSPSPTTTIPSPKDSPPVLVKMKKSKSFDSSKIRRSSRIMSGAGKKPMVDTTVHVLDKSDSEIDRLEKEIDEFELEPVTSTKSEPVKTKKSPTPKKKEVKTAVKAPKTKKKIAVKKSKEKLLPAPLIQPEDEEIFQKYWMTKPVAVSRLYNFAELSSGGVDLVKFVEPFEWKNFFHIKETVYPLLVQAFYYNAQVFPDKDMITSNIKDVELVVDPYVIGSLIGIKSEGLEVYGNDWYDQVKISKEELKRKMFTEEGAKKNSPPSSMLKTEYKLLHNMCQHSFFPRTGSKDKVTDLDILMMYHMAKGVKLNLPYIILHHMIHVATSGYKKIALPYAMLLTRVFRLYYADMDNTISENHYYTFSLKNVHHMKKDVETPAVDVGSKRKRDNFEKTNLNVLADVSGDQLENDLQTGEQTQISGDVDPTTESDKLVTTAAATLQGLKPVSAPQNTTMFSPLMTSSQGSWSSFCTSEFIRNIFTSDTPEISTIPIPKPTDSTLPSIPSSFATFDSFCSSVNATNAGTQQLVFEGNVNFDFPGPSRPNERFRLETDMEQMRKDLDIVIKGMVVNTQ